LGQNAVVRDECPAQGRRQGITGNRFRGEIA
jgi:hypothetical protein